MPLRRRAWVALVGALEASALLLCLATVLGFAGSWHWSFDLFSHFRLQYASGLLTVALLLAGTGRRGAASLLLAFAAINLWLLWPLFTPADPAPQAAATPLRVLLQNVNTRLGSPQRVLDLIDREQPDLLVLQEVDARWIAALAPLEDRYPYRILLPRADNFGMAIYSRQTLAEPSVIRPDDGPIPSIRTTLITTSSRIQLLASHPPPPIGAARSRQRNRTLQTLASAVDPMQPALIIGDLNITRWSPHFRQLLRQSGLMDSAGAAGLQPTWWPPRLPILAIPIDHLLHSAQLRILDRRIGPAVGSDHRALIVDVALTQEARPADAP